jgi:hypothetical protein
MNKEDIIRMAIDAGWDAHHAEFDTRIQTFATLVASAEREACAKLIETTELGGISNEPKLQNFIAALLFGYAQAIRARGNS